MIAHSVEQVDRARGMVVALGNFDGVHRGHQALLARAAAVAREQGIPSVAFTFQTHPLLAMGQDVQLITEQRERERLLLATGIDTLLAVPFTQYQQLSAQAFIEQVFVGQLHVKTAVVGFNNRFGKDSAGDVALLRTLGETYGFAVEVVPPYYVDGMLCSSSNVRKLLAAGDVERAADLLGRPFSLCGDVTIGNQIGRTIGFPTANLLPPPSQLLPKRGVYATDLTVDGVTYPGITNIGTNPTVGNRHVTVETHVLDFEGDLYGRKVRVSFLRMLREERRFSGLSALKAQLSADMLARREDQSNDK